MKIVHSIRLFLLTTMMFVSGQETSSDSDSKIAKDNEKEAESESSKTFLRQTVQDSMSSVSQVGNGQREMLFANCIDVDGYPIPCGSPMTSPNIPSAKPKVKPTPKPTAKPTAQCFADPCKSNVNNLQFKLGRDIECTYENGLKACLKEILDVITICDILSADEKCACMGTFQNLSISIKKSLFGCFVNCSGGVFGSCKDPDTAVCANVPCAAQYDDTTVEIDCKDKLGELKKQEEMVAKALKSRADVICDPLGTIGSCECNFGPARLPHIWNNNFFEKNGKCYVTFSASATGKCAPLKQNANNIVPQPIPLLD